MQGHITTLFMLFRSICYGAEHFFIINITLEVYVYEM